MHCPSSHWRTNKNGQKLDGGCPPFIPCPHRMPPSPLQGYHPLLFLYHLSFLLVASMVKRQEGLWCKAPKLRSRLEKLRKKPATLCYFLMPRCQSTLLDLRDYTCCTFWTTAVEMLGQLVRNTICTTCGQTAWIVFSSPILGTCMIFIHNGVSHIRPTGGSFRRSVFTIRVVCFWNECSEESQSIHP